MKKIFAVVAVLAMLVSLVACSDNDGVNDNAGGQQDSEDQFLVMMYAVGGKNLDPFIVGNMLQSLNAGSTNKVKLTYQYRFSSSYQDSTEVFRNILRFTGDENAGLVGKVNLDSTLNEAYNYRIFEQNIHATHFGDADYIMASDTALTSFIKWSKAMYPKATKTILILSDHGGAWSMEHDGINDNTTTRAILFDDNNITSSDNSMSLSVDEVKNALINAGKVDMLYTDACLMSTWENLTGYADATTYFLGSLETAPGLGGNHYLMIKRLQEADVTDEGLKTAGRHFVDNTVDDWWEDYNKANPDDVYYGDLALYDLRQIGTPLNVITDLTNALVQKYQDTDDVPGLTDTTLGTKWKDYINSAIGNCLVATTYVGGKVKQDEIPKDMIDSLEAQAEAYRLRYGEEIYIIKDGKKCYDGNMVLKLLKQMDYDELLAKSDFADYMKIWDILAELTYDSYPVLDFIQTLVTLLKDAGCTDTTFSTLSQRYYDAINQLGYIRCTMPLEGSVYPMAYQLCSPGVVIFPLNDAAFNDKNTFSGRFSDLGTAAQMLGYYQATDFDKRVHWSRFLQIIDRAPDMVGNPSREEMY